MIINLIQILVSVLLITVILMQSSSAGLGSAWGGDGASGTHTRRGAEKFLLNLTIGLLVVFILLSMIPVLGLA